MLQDHEKITAMNILNTVKHFITRYWKLLLILSVVGIVAGFWYFNTVKSSEKTLTFSQVSRGDLVKTLEVSGSVTAKEYAKMRFAAGGKVVYLGAQEGDVVKKWQTIATIDRASLQNSLQQSLNLYSKERLDWDQQTDDIQDRWIPKQEERTVDKNQLDLDNTVLTVEAADIAIKNTVLSAPFSGVLVSSPTTVTGVNLLATDVFEVVNPETLMFKAIVDELDIALVHPGQTVDLVFDAYPDETYHSTVEFISYKSSQTSTGTVFLVDVPLKNLGGLEKFRIGMNGDVTIHLERKDQALYVPIESTRERDGKTFVDVKIDEQNTEEREIVTGLETSDDIEVLSGLHENDEVLLPE